MSVAGNPRVFFFPIIPTSCLLILLQMLPLFLTFINHSSAHNGGGSSPSSSTCPPSSCGNVPVIKYPFRLKTDPESCRLGRSPYYLLDCQNNQTILNVESVTYFVQEINYREKRIRLVDPGLNDRGTLSSCPRSSNSSLYNWYGPSPFQKLYSLNPIYIAFIHCISNVDSVGYVKAPYCGNKGNIFANSSKIYSFVSIVGRNNRTLDYLEENCTVDGGSWVSATAPIAIHDALAYGFELQYWPPDSLSIPGMIIGITTFFTLISISVAIVGLAFVKFIIGFPLLIWLVVHTWKRRHVSIDKTIEDFLQGQHNFVPIKYSYSEIKKMTTNFAHKLGEGAHGVVYKGKLRSGPYVAIKMMQESIVTEEEFINEVGTIGHIHHVNIVQLIGFCVKRSKYALVYEFLPNGSLDRYIFNQQSLGALAMTLENMFEIALGVARGIAYLHHGCNMRILHFDIKPHNILLDEKLNPKISDFGLARLYSTDESFLNLTGARGTVGYMAPEMFYKNFGGVSSKADVYSFGMMLMEMVGKRTNINPFDEDMNQTHFPSLVYDQLCIGKEIDIKDASEEEKVMMKKIIIVALWCLQMRPTDRPSMIKVIDMFEGDTELQMPPMSFISPRKVAGNDQGISGTYGVNSVNLDLKLNSVVQVL